MKNSKKIIAVIATIVALAAVGLYFWQNNAGSNEISDTSIKDNRVQVTNQKVDSIHWRLSTSFW